MREHETDGLIATIDKNSAEQLRVTLSQYKGRWLFGARVWWHSVDSDDWHPSKKGFAVSVERLPQLRAAAQEAERQARERGLLESVEPDEAA